MRPVFNFAVLSATIRIILKAQGAGEGSFIVSRLGYGELSGKRRGNTVVQGSVRNGRVEMHISTDIDNTLWQSLRDLEGLINTPRTVGQTAGLE